MLAPILLTRFRALNSGLVGMSIVLPGWPTIYTLILSVDNASVWRSAFAKPDCGRIFRGNYVEAAWTLVP